MYRLVLLLVVIQALAVHSMCHHCSRCAHRRHDYRRLSHRNDKDFNDLSRSVVHADRTAQRVCDGQASTTETFYTNHYEISVPLPDYTEDQISVKLKHRVLYIQAVKGKEKIFSVLRIIPEFAKGNAATWTFDKNVLTVHVPYEIAFDTEVVKVCNSTIDESVMTIPKASTDFTIDNGEITIDFDDEIIF